MIRVSIDASELTAAAQVLPGAHAAALRAAFRGEAARLLSVERSTLKGGVGEAKAPLTQAEAKKKGPEALAAFERATAYEVFEGPSGPEALIGFTAAAERRRKLPPVAQLEKVVPGFRVTVTRGMQAWMAYKLRKRRGEPVAMPGEGLLSAGGRWTDSQRKRRNQGARWKALAAKMPKVGTTVEFPRRDLMADLAGKEAEASARNIALLYELKLAGIRWDRSWWKGAWVGESARVGGGATALMQELAEGNLL